MTMLENHMVTGAQALIDAADDDALTDQQAQSIAFDTLKQRATDLLNGKVLAIEVPGFKAPWSAMNFLEEDISGKDGAAVMTYLARLVMGAKCDTDAFIAQRAEKFAAFYASDLVEEWKGEEL